MKNKKIQGGLNELPRDDRDFVFASVFGKKELPDFPENLFNGNPIVIKDQGNTDFCTAYAVTSVSEDQEGFELNPHYVFAKTRLLSKEPLQKWGANLRDACQALVKFGSITQDVYPFGDKDQNKDRDFLADFNNWNPDLDMLAWDHAKNSFFRVDTGPFDTFDNIRVALMDNKDHMRSIVTGSNWFDSWTKADRGLVSEEEPKGSVGGHAFKVFGFTTIDDIEYLVAQLSNGTNIGDGGIFYFPRAIVNKYFTFGAFMFHDMPKDQAEHYSDAGISVKDSKIIRILKTIKSIIKKLV